MARVDIAPVELDDAGVNPPSTAGTVDGWSFTNHGKEFAILKNTGAGSHTVTIVTTETVDDLAVPDRTIAIPAGETRIAGPFAPGIYNDANNKVFVNIDATPAEVAIQVCRFPE